jgi:indolepyruvate ferredoxin oxidoreductase beta subunit
MSDLLVSFERLEALRWRHLLAPVSQMLINDMNMTPVTVSSGQQAAVADLSERLSAEYPKALYIDALTVAKKLGNTRAMNMVVAGAISKLMPFELAVWEQAMKERIPAKLLDMNIKAFEAGCQLLPAS